MVSTNDEHKLSISVLIPLTGLKAIDETVDSVIKQKYSADEIIILRNDIKELPEDIEFVEISDKVQPFREVFIQKRGKGNALNIGISLAAGELICVLDADCMLDDNALMNIVGHFKDESVVAAGGRLSVIQRNRKLIVKVQNYEYIRTFQITRNVFATLNAQCLISGAFGVFRKSSLMEVNGYVAVFCSDKKTAYEYTSIQVKDLPYDLQNEIKNGKYVKDTESLYSFLENYTS